MGSQRKSPAKKLPYKVFGKKVVHGEIKSELGDALSTVRVRSEWPKDDERYAIAQEARRAALERKAREDQQKPESIHRYVLK